jgi:hypothetical protein
VEKTKMQQDLEAMEKAARGIVSLCEDKQLGLTTWYEILNDQMKVIYDIYRSSNGLDG